MSIRANRHRPDFRPLDPETIDRIRKRVKELNDAKYSRPYDMTHEDYYTLLKKKGAFTSQMETDWMRQYEYWSKQGKDMDEFHPL